MTYARGRARVSPGQALYPRGRHGNQASRLLVRLLCIALSVGILLGSAPGRAAEPLVVAIKDAPPFVTKGPGGTWTGPAVDLWQHAATVLDRSFEFREMTLSEMLKAVETGTADIAVGALSVTTAREERFDFSHPFHSTGFGLATRRVGGAGFFAVVSKVISTPFLTAAGALLLVLFATGFVVFLLERRHNAEQFGGGFWSGLGSGFWWSAVTMTTVGYGDKAPRTLAGRVIAVVWMFAAVVTISGFTASIASSLTVETLTAVNGPEDLAAARVGTVGGSSSEEYLRSERIAPRVFQGLPAALAGLAAGDLDAVVYDLPLLAYQLQLHPEWQQIAVLPGTLTTQQYAFAVPTGSPLREQLNRIIPQFVGTPAWRDSVAGY